MHYRYGSYPFRHASRFIPQKYRGKIATIQINTTRRVERHVFVSKISEIIGIETSNGPAITACVVAAVRTTF